MKSHPLKLIGLSALLALGCFASTAVGPAKTRPWVGKQMSVGVYCGASDRADPKYAELARELGAAVAQRGWTLVWGGSRTGLMGAVAAGAREAGGRTVGVLPEFIHRWEVADNQADELLVVTTMHERKMLLQVRSDVFVVLPGGIGTLDEIADTLDLRNLDQHRKVMIIVNQGGYYDGLRGFIDHTVTAKFTKQEVYASLRFVPTLADAVKELELLSRAP